MNPCHLPISRTDPFLVTNWNLTVTLSNGANPFTVQGYDRFTNALTGTNASITITKQ